MATRKPPFISATPRANMVKWRNSRMNSPVNRYMLSSLYSSYGNPQMGDLFNDIMGAVVPKWDDRPDWMKSIKINPDPVKLVQAASKVIPPKEVGRVVDQAAKYGVNLNYITPAGQVPITGGMVASGYQNLPMIASLSNKLSDIPTWVYITGGIGLLIVVVMAAKK